MQLMPKNGWLHGRQALPRAPAARLVQSEYNIELGQSYVQHLLEFPGIEGNLFFTTVAYNGGPGNFNVGAASEFQDDPLLFIESVPSRDSCLCRACPDRSLDLPLSSRSADTVARCHRRRHLAAL